ncbi:MAG: hypothetical protein CK424_02520 [Legionella sp.]|nr:MAG: hypothetical protein CK424_02520 [Legionella sp.]
MMTFVPQITTPAGACLTVLNWEELGMDTAVCSMSSLLMKPGLAHLQTLTHLAHYLGWNKDLVLDASMLVLKNHTHFMIQSVYDGMRISVSLEEFWGLVQSLQPNIVLLPKNLLEKDIPQLPSSILPFFSFDATPKTYDKPFGLYGSVNSARDHHASIPIYLQDDEGHCSVLEADFSVRHYYASDKPAADAYHGLVYEEHGTITISEKQFATQFELLDSKCTCSTCKQGFTRAYLHHLFHSTPLLCQRFLIIHNMTWFQKALSLKAGG